MRVCVCAFVRVSECESMYCVVLCFFPRNIGVCVCFLCVCGKRGGKKQSKGRIFLARRPHRREATCASRGESDAKPNLKRHACESLTNKQTTRKEPQPTSFLRKEPQPTSFLRRAPRNQHAFCFRCWGCLAFLFDLFSFLFCPHETRERERRSDVLAGRKRNQHLGAGTRQVPLVAAPLALEVAHRR